MDKHKITMIGKTSKEVMSNFKTKEDSIEALEILISAFKNEEKIIKMFEDGAEELYDGISRTTGVSKQVVVNVIANYLESMIFGDDLLSPYPASYRIKSDTIIFDNRGEAETVLEHMDDIIAKYGYCSIADLYDLVGYTSDYTDTKAGWTDLRGVSSITRDRYGYTLKLPKPVTIK